MFFLTLFLFPFFLLFPSPFFLSYTFSPFSLSNISPLFHFPVPSFSLTYAPNMFASIYSYYSFSFLVTFHPPDPNDLNSQAPPAQTFHQISQDSPSHSAAQMRCLESFLVVRIPSLASLVSQCTPGVILAVLSIFFLAENS